MYGSLTAGKGGGLDIRTTLIVFATHHCNQNVLATPFVNTDPGGLAGNVAGSIEGIPIGTGPDIVGGCMYEAGGKPILGAMGGLRMMGPLRLDRMGQ
jgi:hypothetical protein